MTETQIADRLFELTDILEYSKIKTAIFTTGEKICINQERASLFELQDYNSGLREFKDCRQYKVSAEIQKKIHRCIVDMHNQ